MTTQQSLVQLPNIESIVESLLESYNSDNEKFIPKVVDKFHERNLTFEEESMLRQIFFPRHWNSSSITNPTSKPELTEKIYHLYNFLGKGVHSYSGNDEDYPEIGNAVLNSLVKIREELKKDVLATYDGDPAANSYTEIIRNYPGVRAISNHRVVHELYKKGAKEYARDIAKEIHTLTGIDIHSGAEIGEYFFIDHGTGVVIGETAKIGNHVRIYQGVTLGAISLSLKKVGELRESRRKRHPTVEDYVTIYAGAVVLGGETIIGKGSTIGGGVFITESIPPNSKVYLTTPPHQQISNSNTK